MIQFEGKYGEHLLQWVQQEGAHLADNCPGTWNAAAEPHLVLQDWRKLPHEVLGLLKFGKDAAR